MTKQQRISVYLFGVVIGLIVLFFIPRQQKEEHPWHEQTAPEGFYPRTVTDDMGRTVIVDRQPRWIVSLAPSITETLVAMGMGDHLRGITKFGAVPEDVGQPEVIGGIQDPNFEKIISLGGDLVIGTEISGPSVYERFDSLGIPAIAYKHEGVEDVISDIASIGTLLGVPRRALELIREIGARREAVRSRLAGVEPKRVLLTYDIDELTAAGSGGWAGDLIDEVGAVNIAADASSSWPKLSLEAVLAQNPEVVLITAYEDSREQVEREIEQLQDDPVWSRIAAVQNDAVRIIDGHLLDVPGPGLGQALTQIAAAIYPERFEEGYAPPAMQPADEPPAEE